MGESRAACSIPGCDREHYARGYCSKHYQAARNHGELDARPTRHRVGVCVVDGCQAPDRGAHGLCNTHQKRMQRHGSVEHAGRSGGPGFIYRGDEITYSTAHRRVHKARGSASLHGCVDCSAPAAHWSYDHACPNEMRDGRGFGYSADVWRYQPRCAVCHRAFDRAPGVTR